MTLNDVLLAQNIAHQQQTEIARAWRNDVLRAARAIDVVPRLPQTWSTVDRSDR